MDTNQVRAILQERLKILEAREDRVESDRRRERGPLSADWEEQSLELENDEVLAGFATRTPDEVAETRAALERLQEGTYGICADCGEPISPARLKAIPHTRWCVACKERA